MNRTQRSSLSGLSRTGLLLACAGSGAAVVLASVIFLGGGSRAAEPARPTGAGRPAAEPDESRTRPNTADLVPAAALEDASPTPEVAPSALVPSAAPTLAPAATIAASATAEAAAKDDGPKLRVVKGEGQREELGKGELGNRSRKQLREQRARDAEQAAATGETRTSPAKKTVDPEQRARVGRRKRPDGG